MRSSRLARAVRADASSQKQTAVLKRPVRRACEVLESRTMMCIDHVIPNTPVVEERPDLVNVRASGEGSEPANIVWENRGSATSDTDGFNARFGAAAEAARAVADAVIVAYERMIGSFNYATSGATYSLTVNMSGAGSGFGASAGLSSQLGGKPKSGSISMGAGSGSTPNGTGNGWFLDPTPYESSEFQGTIVNAFSGNAQSGSPAASKGDFYTVFAAELTHCIGLFGNAVPGWAARTTATTVTDTAEGGGTGQFWIFDGPSIQHLLTSNNGGSGGQNFNSGIHSAGPITTTINGITYSGAQDQGNAVYEFGRRYMVNNVFALMFKDAYGYGSVDPALYGTMYSSLNETTNQLLVRGGTGVSADDISVTRVGNTLRVSVDVGLDVAGTGALPGAGNLPAFVTEYDISEVTTLLISAGDGNDTVTLDGDLGLTVSLAGGTGTDALVLNGNAGDNNFAYAGATASAGTTNIVSLATTESISFSGGDGIDTLTLTGSASAETFNLNAGTFTGARVGSFATIESLIINTLGGADTVNVNAPAAATLIDVGTSGDFVNINETLPGLPTSLLATATGAANTVVAVNDLTGVATFDVPAPLTLNTLTLRTGGTVAGSGDLTINGASTWSGGTLTGSGQTLVTGAASLAINTTDDKKLDRLFKNDGAVNWSAGNILVGSMAQVLNNGIFSVMSINSGDLSLSPDTGVSAPNSFVNNGTIKTTETDGSTTLNVPLNNAAIVEIMAQTSLALLAGGTHTGSFVFGSLGELTLGLTHTLAATSEVTGLGILNLDRAKATFNGVVNVRTISIDWVDVPNPGINVFNAAVNVRSLFIDAQVVFNGTTRLADGTSLMIGETISGTGDLVLESGTFDFSGGTLGGSGLLRIESGGIFTIGGNGTVIARKVRSTGMFDTSMYFATLALGLSATSPAVIATNLGPTTNPYFTYSRLDLTDNAIVLDYTGVSPLDAVRASLGNSYNGGAWNGDHLRSSTAATTPGRTVGYGEATSLFGALPATFAGATIDDTSVLIRYTIPGDANLDASVNFDDLLITAQSYGASGKTFAQGNYNYDAAGNVDFDDLLMLAQQYGTSLITVRPTTGVDAVSAKKKGKVASSVL